MKFNIKIAILALLPFICFILGYAISNILIGNKSYTTPNLIGLTMHEAVAQTSPFQINIQLAAEKECPGIAHGTIMSQKPATGRLIKSHQSIMVITSKQPNMINAPRLIGLSESEIATHCAQQHIKCKTYKLEHQLPASTCIAQTPPQEQPLPDKKMVAYIADSQANNYIMPNLLEKPLQDVVSLFKQYPIQLQLFAHHQKILPPYPEDLTITTQKPSAGSFVSLQNNTIIQLEVA